MHVQLAISATIRQVFVTIHGPQLTSAIKEPQQNIEALTNQQFIHVFQDRSLSCHFNRCHVFTLPTNDFIVKQLLVLISFIATYTL